MTVGKVVNLFPGPGAGKSTTAADLFAELKYRGHNAELIPEYAKDLTWGGASPRIFAQQDYIFGKQHMRLARVGNQVDFLVTDSPLLICSVYAEEYNYLHKGAFHQLVKSAHDSFDNLNIVLRRTKKYQQQGRNQDEKQARDLDDKIINCLMVNDIPFEFIDYGRGIAVPAIIELMVRHGWGVRQQ